MCFKNFPSFFLREEKSPLPRAAEAHPISPALRTDDCAAWVWALEEEEEDLRNLESSEEIGLRSLGFSDFQVSYRVFQGLRVDKH